jgi:8-oxo-dGTP pyrophosphatase MutT (NUDIX family)
VDRTHRSSGAVVVSTGGCEPRVLLLEQVRATGERQWVAPKGTIEAGETPLAAAVREVSEEAGLTGLHVAGHLGSQEYAYISHAGHRVAKTVDWYLFLSDHEDAVPRAAEGFVAVRWLPLAEAAAAFTHPEFRPFIERARRLLDEAGSSGGGDLTAPAG